MSARDLFDIFAARSFVQLVELGFGDLHRRLRLFQIDFILLAVDAHQQIAGRDLRSLDDRQLDYSACHLDRNLHFGFGHDVARDRQPCAVAAATRDRRHGDDFGRVAGVKRCGGGLLAESPRAPK